MKNFRNLRNSKKDVNFLGISEKCFNLLKNDKN